jgi:hypothetical protein
MKKRTNTAAAASIALALSLPFLACSGGDDPAPPVVYVAGYMGNPDNNAARATYWKDGAPTQLSQATSRANSIYVSGGTVYVAGSVGSVGNWDAANRATLWTNGSPRQLSDVRSIALSVYASGNNVYVAGAEWDSSFAEPDWAATIWRYDGAQWSKQRLTTNHAVAYSVHVPGSTVYASGSEVLPGQSYQPATVWTGDSARHIDSDLKYGFANSVYFSGGTVYAAGEFGASNDGSSTHRAFCWYSDNGGTRQMLSEDSPGAANSVHVSGDDICVAGWHNPSGNADGSRAVLWRNKDGSVQLSQIPSQARSVHISGSDVYVAGWENDSMAGDYTGLHAALWKNGARQAYLGNTTSTAYSVFVTQ